MKKWILIAFIPFFISCASIRFINNDRVLASQKPIVIQNKIHHIGLLGLHEFSDPVSTRKICNKNNFVYIKTENNLKTWAISYIGSALAVFFPPLAVFSMLYTPVAVEVACSLSNNKRSVANVSKKSSEKFRVLKSKKSKAIVIFSSGFPSNTRSFELVNFEGSKIQLIKKGREQALLHTGDLKLEAGKTYFINR